MDIIYLIGAFDAAVIAGLGLVAAGLLLLGKEAAVFWNRVLPACGVLIGTSIGAGIVFSIARAISGAG